MKVTCANRIFVGDNRTEAVFGFSGHYDIEIEAATFGEAADKAIDAGHIPISVQSPSGNWVTVPQTEDIFIKALPSRQWPPELATAS